MEDRARFTLLLDKWYEAGLSPEEEQELMDLIAGDNFDDILRKHIDMGLEGSSGSGWTAGDNETGAARLLDAIHARRKVFRAPERTGVLRSVRYKWVAAAAVLIIVAAGGLRYFRSGGQHLVHAIRKSTAMAPGGNLAYLTLADGSVVALDSAGKGPIMNGQLVAAVKLDSGLLSYRAIQEGKSAPEPGFHKLSTPRGGQYQLILPDGTHAWLNSASSLYFPTAFTGGTREVTVEGEAYFEVAEDPGKPFIVTANKMKINVLGTHFNVMAYADEDAICATLLQGSIKVAVDGAARLIRPGQQAILKRSMGALQVREGDTGRAIAWTRGFFDFKGADIRTIMRQVSRWYDVDVTYGDPIPEVSLSGVISRKQDASQLLDILAATHKVRFDTLGNRIKVLSSP